MVFTLDPPQNVQCSNYSSENILNCFHVGCQCFSQSVDDYIFGYDEKNINENSKSVPLEKEPLSLCLQMFEDSQLAEGLNVSLVDGCIYSQQREDELIKDELIKEEVRKNKIQEEETIQQGQTKKETPKCPKETTELIDRIISIYNNINVISEPFNCNTIDYKNNIRQHNGCPTCGCSQRFCEC